MSPLICHPSGAARNMQFLNCWVLSTQICLFVEYKILVLAKTGIIVKYKHVQTGHSCSIVVDDEDSKENLRKILQNKIGFMLKATQFTW